MGRARFWILFLFVLFCALDGSAQNVPLAGVGSTPCFSNLGFEKWTDGMPDGWTKFNDVVGTISSNVTVEERNDVTYAGSQSVKVSTISPSGGIQQSIGASTEQSWMVFPAKGKGAMHFAKSDGTSSYFTTNTLLQGNFNLVTTQEQSTAIRCAYAMRIENNDFIELFSASSFSENDNEGGIYIKRNDGDPSLFMNVCGYKTWSWAGVADLSSMYLWVSMRMNLEGHVSIHATDVSRDFRTLTNDRVLFSMEGFNVQAYNMIKLGSGRYVIPIVFARIGEVYRGPLSLDILYTDDNFKTVTRLDTPRTIKGRGLMEAHPVLLSTGEVAILCRTDQGYLARAIYDPVKNTLSNASLMDIAQVESGSYARNLDNGDILLSWVSSVDSRKVVVMATSSDDMATWKSFHVLATSESLGDSMHVPFPYVHQPYVFQDGPNLVAYVERVISPTEISLYKCTGMDYTIDNITNSLNSWQNLTSSNLPASTTSVQLMNVINRDAEVYYDNLKGEPSYQFAITGPENICNSSTAEYHVPYLTGVGYRWVLPSGWNIKSGQGTSSVTVKTGFASGYVVVIPSNSCGEGRSVAVKVLVKNMMNSPQMPGGEQLVDLHYNEVSTYNIPEIEEALGYKWALEPAKMGTLDANGTWVTIKWNKPGIAMLTIVATGECSTFTSEALEIEVRNSFPVAVNESVSVYPNPVKEKLFIKSQKQVSLEGIALFDIKGIELPVKRYRIQDGVISIDVKGLYPGNYILKIVAESEVIVRKVIKV